LLLKIASPAVFRRYWALTVLGSWPWPFRVTWRHQSRDHSISHRPLPICFFMQFLARRTV